ncbi:S-layer homology domain-containing protein [Thermodesulfitimonas autotrophica]|uniref:S-layer homology domain-containing protein n=1 Tax=Thermodesulfitimonas autotrophica TaxID=1894989 RepID=UPI000F4F13AA|nr:S-layer homology domain-containing protein [Thermodesulfitimonas autotrophica]
MTLVLLLSIFSLPSSFGALSLLGGLTVQERVSLTNGGAEANGDSYHPSISADGRYVAFTSDADNLVAGDTNRVADVFVYDRETRRIERVSVADSGQQGNGSSYLPSISANGRYVAFVSEADNLVAGDKNRKPDVFVFDRTTRTIERVSVSSSGTEGNGEHLFPSISADGRFVAFVSDSDNLVADDTNKKADVFIYDRKTHRLERVSVSPNGAGNGDSLTACLAGGGLVAFASEADNLVTGDRNGVTDIFVAAAGPSLPAAPRLSFSDLQGHWAAGVVGELAVRGLVYGYPDGTFRPEQKMTRAEATVILVRLLGLAPGDPAVLNFRDAGCIPAWAREAVAAAVQEGIVKGYPEPNGEVSFGAERAVSRVELAVLATRLAAKRLGPAAPAALTFRDAGAIPVWARDALGIALAQGLVTGYPDCTFRPEKSVTRAEAAAIIHRLLAITGGA